MTRERKYDPQEYLVIRNSLLSVGMEGNWLQTIPGKSWFIALRMYGPLQPWIDQTWRPGEIELVE